MKLLLLCISAGLVAACGTPCGAPGRLCAPISSITSPLPPAPAPRPIVPPPEPPPPAAQTFAVMMPPPSATRPAEDRSSPAPAPAYQSTMPDDSDAQPSDHTIRMALLLPLRSETLGPAAESVRAGFIAAWEHEHEHVAVTVIETGDVAQDVLSSYASALERQDIIIGPLARSAVAAVASSALVSKPTIALNYPEGAAPLPTPMLAMGLSIEEEARQAAQWASAEHPNSSALILTTSTPWQRRVAAAFAAQWQRYGMPVKTVELSAPNGYLSDPELVQLRARIQAETPNVLFSAMGADQTRQLRNALNDTLTGPAAAPALNAYAEQATSIPDRPAPSSALPVYGTSALNPGNGNNFGTPELDGVHLLDLPWQLQPDHPAVMVYPHPAAPAERKPGAADMERLYALGIDAYRVALEIGRHPASRFQLDGVTGRLTIGFGQGPASFDRTEQPAVYKNGVAQPVTP